MLVVHFWWAQPLCEMALSDSCLLDLRLVARLHPAEIVSVIRASPAVIAVAQRAQLVLPEAILEHDIRPSAHHWEISDQATAVVDDIRVATSTIGLVGQRSHLLVGLRVQYLGHLAGAPHHGPLVTCCETAVAADDIGVTAGTVAEVVGVLRVERAVHGRLQGRVWVASSVANWVVTAIGHTF